jgi:predicted aldo/keto reductase-like oxidoreductase
MGLNQYVVDRRGFIGRMAAGVAALGFVKAGMGASSDKTDSLKVTAPKGQLIRRKLGKTGIELPVVSMGVMNTGNPALVKKAWESGIRHFDTAAAYWGGQNEMMLGKALREIGAKDAVIATKAVLDNLKNLKAEEARNMVVRKAEESLKRLGMDSVDIYYLHDISDPSVLSHPGALEGLAALKKAGKIRFPGFTSHMNMAACIEAALSVGSYEVILAAYNYALGGNADLVASFEHAFQKGVGLVAMKTQCSQYWYRDQLPGTEKAFYDGSLMHSAMLKWVARHPFMTTAVPGFTTFQQLEEDIAVAANLEFTADEKAFLEKKGVSVTLGYCTQCGACLASCPNGAQVPALMRAHLYAARYRNFDRARSAIADLPKPGLGLCSGCKTCSARCVRGVDVASRLSDLKRIFC